jgi:hypothetical protein
MSKQKMISAEKLIKHIDEMMEMNYDNIENDMDGDGHCEIENMVLDNILFFINEGRYDK